MLVVLALLAKLASVECWEQGKAVGTQLSQTGWALYKLMMHVALLAMLATLAMLAMLKSLPAEIHCRNRGCLLAHPR